MKNIILAIVIVILAGVVFFTHPFSKKTENTETPPTATTTENVTTTEQNVATSTNVELTLTANEINPTANDKKIVKELQTIWNSYLSAIKAHDVKKTSELSFQLSSYCANPDKYQKECFDSMDAVAKAFENIKTTDFTIEWSDKMQAILVTELKPATLDNNPGYYQPRIFFGVKDGQYKVLSVFPDWGRFANKNKVKPEDLNSFLKKGLIDSDRDGFTDMEENCDNGGGPGSLEGCKKTDPLVRDENKNGWWDGVEAYIRPISN